MQYVINTFDDSAPGMERLRHQSEFILLAYPSTDSGLDDIRQQWIDDIQSCARPDDFDYDAARDAVNDWCDDNASRMLHALGALHQEGFAIADEYDHEGPCLRLYVECIK